MISPIFISSLQFGDLKKGGSPDDRTFTSERKAKKKAEELNKSAKLPGFRFEWGVEPTTDNRGNDVYQVRRLFKERS